MLPEGRRWSLPSSPRKLRVGTDPRCDLTVDDARVARLHCWIERRRGALLLIDAGSPGGTWVNGVRVGRAHLSSAAVIRIGETHLVPIAAGRPMFPTLEGFVRDAVNMHGAIHRTARAIGVPRSTLTRWIDGGLARKRGEHLQKKRPAAGGRRRSGGRRAPTRPAS